MSFGCDEIIPDVHRGRGIACCVLHFHVLLNVRLWGAVLSSPSVESQQKQRSTTIGAYVHGNSVRLPWYLHGTSIPPWRFHVLPCASMVLPCASMRLPWCFHVLPWDCHGSSTVQPCSFHGVFMGFPWGFARKPLLGFGASMMLP